MADQYNVWILEDDPYGELYFEGEPADYRSLKSMDTSGRVVNLGTFSKILSPGMRVGWMVGPQNVIAKCEIARQAQDACGTSFTQLICADYMASGRIQPALANMRNGYRQKRDLMGDSICAHFPDWVGVSQPNGGFFFWLDLKGRLASKTFFNRCIDRGVALVTGHAFMPQADADRCCRVAFSSADVSKIDQGIAKMGHILKNI